MQADVGVFGGSGFYRLLDDVEEHKVETPYGPPSDVVTIGRVGSKRVAFLPRHGRTHALPPHRINYRANVWAMKQLGVRWLFGPCAVGSLQPHVRPGDFVLCDQFVDRTSGRADTFYDGPVTTHVSSADPYCPTLRQLVAQVAREQGLPLHERGTVVVIQGPRFSTRAESRWFRSQGWEVINMTQYPEAHLARELALCYVNISLVTDYDVGVEGDPTATPVTAEEVMRQFAANNAKLRDLILESIARLPETNTCPLCPRALDHARVG
ncbi:MAG: S-methyl-5'-thioadenosine phosphorylase [Armatimonadota bacterium]|nr:S-methyl-5'-thioadenosine phosphorylase [Armatimonadota bacterium]MDR5676564.1 S-methyl-5'-thioadenosine phosphorylase [Armatimonadota bacterium]MDR5688410.1 S-methyl-5'-thioadenosine phosphorylase [Armatimonadota bacterium]MDR7387424.1 S-methyl-5'-thioadenosine phosphorylase [Armatimonadota bacterium]MDR7388558.1 S-methyl-5'-thioadenosine phosphorylase [Armatimonadota bacterium]